MSMGHIFVWSRRSAGERAQAARLRVCRGEVTLAEPCDPAVRSLVVSLRQRPVLPWMRAGVAPGADERGMLTSTMVGRDDPDYVYALAQAVEVICGLEAVGLRVAS